MLSHNFADICCNNRIITMLHLNTDIRLIRLSYCTKIIAHYVENPWLMTKDLYCLYFMLAK